MCDGPDKGIVNEAEDTSAVEKPRRGSAKIPTPNEHTMTGSICRHSYKGTKNKDFDKKIPRFYCRIPCIHTLYCVIAFQLASHWAVIYECFERLADSRL